MRIGVFDSGVGGLTVLRELQNRYPLQTFIYFGDTANVPYGTKSVSQIRSLSQHAAEKMKSHSLDLLIVACNTASSLALDVMKNELQPTPVIGVVEAGVNSVLSQMQDHDTALILGTRATVQSHIYRDLIQAAGPEIRVLEQACPLLVPMIEEGWRDHPILTATITEYVKPYLDRAPAVEPRRGIRLLRICLPR
ncbi:MAG: glutamate racemase, partial [Proteobacteria bacterium]